MERGGALGVQWGKGLNIIVSALFASAGTRRVPTLGQCRLLRLISILFLLASLSSWAGTPNSLTACPTS